MRVLQTTDAVGGVWTYSLELARALAPHGVRTALACLGPSPSPAQRAEAAGTPGVDLLCEHHGALEWMHEPWEDVRDAGRWLRDLEDDVHPELVHLNGYCHASLPWRAPMLVVAHSCVCSWWQAVKGEPAPAEWDRYRREVTRGIQAADRIAAPTRAMLDALDRHYGPLPPACVISNGRDPGRFGPAEKQPLIFSAGRLWDEAKNLRALDEAAADLPWPVYVAGDQGSLVPRHVHTLGQLAPAELAGWLGRASIYAPPAKYEPFGLSALEAALSGCALVLGDIPSLREVWGDAAVFVPADDPLALRSALHWLISDEALRAEMAHRARVRAARYTPERMAADYLEVYRSLAGSRREVLACA